MSEIRLLLVDDNPQFLDSIKRMLGFEPDFRIAGTAASGKEALDLMADETFDVALVDIHLPDIHGFELTKKILEADPTIQPIILSVDYGADKLLEAMKAGAKNFIQKPPSSGKLADAIREAYKRKLETSPLISPPSIPKEEPKVNGKVIAVYSGKGGVGCTFLATNLALHLHSRETPAALVDCDLQFGDIPVFLNMHARYTIYELAGIAAELEHEVVEDALLVHPSGLKVLAAPPQPELADAITVEVMNHVLDHLRTSYSYILIDMASDLNDVAVEIFDIADLILMVMTPDIPSIKNMTYVVDVMYKLGVPHEKLTVVLNMVGQKGDISPARVENSINIPFAAQLPYDNAEVKRSINRGEPLGMENKTGILGQRLIQLVGVIKERLIEEAEPA
jgi:pilus assembly protein CpaE